MAEVPLLQYRPLLGELPVTPEKSPNAAVAQLLTSGDSTERFLKDWFLAHRRARGPAW